MTVIESVTRASSYDDRVAIAEDADRRHDRIIDDVLRNGFAFDWSAALTVSADHPLQTIERHLAQQVHASRALGETVAAIGINARLLAMFIQRKHERLLGIRAPIDIHAFREEFALPEGSIDYWTRVLGLDESQVEVVRQWITEFLSASQEIGARVTDALMRRVTKLYSEAITGEGGLESFIREAREVLPDASRSLLETEYRTHMTTHYESTRREQVLQRASIFPFTQYLAIKDTRTTWWICRPMGTAGPQGRGYVAASDDPIWIPWTPPNHYNCRAALSPIGYREAQRMGILAADGRTKIALVGDNPMRPYGDPPQFAENPDTGELRRVEPQEGFAA